MIRSKHNDLLNYFVHDARDLSPAYVKKCELFLSSLRGLITKKDANVLYKKQASKDIQAPQLEYTSKHRKTCTKNKQAK